MILTDREIVAALRCKHISITPTPSDDALSPTAIDLTLGDSFSVWDENPGVIIRPGVPGYSYSRLLKHQQTFKSNTFTIKPKTLVLAWTRETVDLPVCSKIAARVEGKSSMARVGVGIHITAPTIHSGFRGQVQLEMYNFGPHEIILDAGMRICQLIFEQTLGTPEQGYGGVFLDQKPEP